MTISNRSGDSKEMKSMLRPLALIGTVGLMAMAINTVNAQQASSCPTCNNSGGIYNAPAYDTGNWQYADCDTGNCKNSSNSLCSTKGFPDKGWNPPARYPVNRNGIWYRNYWPKAWYGNAGGGFIGNAPMVYQPTDTTQLGYSYAKVPTWQATRMIPPTPCPANYHARVCVPRQQQGPLPNPCQGGACQSCQQGFTMHGMPGSNMPRMAMAPASQPVPQMVQVPQVIEAPPIVTEQQIASGVTNAAVRNARPVSHQKKKGLFRLTRLKYLFD
jgi:hypothetical protein